MAADPIYPKDVLARVQQWADDIHCHEGDFFYQRMHQHEPLRWQRIDGSPWCRYCGSISPQHLLELLAGGAKLGGADWKYGWPHKFYLSGSGVPRGMVEWKNDHLMDLDDETFAEVAAILDRYSGILFERVQTDTGVQLGYRAPYRGYQR